MTHLCIACERVVPLPCAELSRRILQVEHWADFEGYGPLPGIRSAGFEERTAAVVGSRIRVTNVDGSSHLEEIVGWEVGRRADLQMREFSFPLSWLARCIDETWLFESQGDSTRVIRTFAQGPRAPLARPGLGVISILLRKASERHLAQLR